MAKYKKKGIRREQNKVVVIGLCEGWDQIKKNKPGHIYIFLSSSYLDHLSHTPGALINEIICSGHRTAAIENLAYLEIILSKTIGCMKY